MTVGRDTGHEPRREKTTSTTGAGMKNATTPPVTRVEVFCDGACSGNPGPGGYGVLVRAPGRQDVVRSAGKARTTNNEMELLGAISGLEAALLWHPREIVICTDSQYVVKGMTEWIAGWKRNNWRTSARTPVKNRELWERLDALCSHCRVSWRWIKGHAGHAENELCDRLAVRAIREVMARTRTRDEGEASR